MEDMEVLSESQARIKAKHLQRMKIPELRKMRDEYGEKAATRFPARRPEYRDMVRLIDHVLEEKGAS